MRKHPRVMSSKMAKVFENELRREQAANRDALKPHRDPVTGKMARGYSPKHGKSL